MNRKQTGAVIASAALVAGLGLGSLSNVAEAITIPDKDVAGVILMGDSGTINDIANYLDVTRKVDEKTKTITWDVYFNQNHEYWRFGCTEQVFLPGGLDNSTVVIERRYQVKNSNEWIEQAPFVNGKSSAGQTYYAESPSDPDWVKNWNSAVVNGAAKKDSSDLTYSNALEKWYTSGILTGPRAASIEGWGTDAKFHWTVTAKYKDDISVDPYDLPFVFGVQSGPGNYPYFLAYGPFNSDNHNLTDTQEGRYGLNPLVVDVLSDYIKPTVPFADKLILKNKNNLTPEEQKQVKELTKKAIENGIDANPRFNADQKAQILNGTTIEVAPTGVVTITYPDNGGVDARSVTTLTQKDYAKTAAPTVNSLTSMSKKIAGTGLPGDLIEVTFPNNEKRTTYVSPEGTWSIPVDVTTPIAKDDTLYVTQKDGDIAASEVITTVVQPNIAESIDVVVPSNKVVVDDIAAVDEAEKSSVEDAIRGVNTFPENTKVDVADNGDTTITYPDGSKDTISGSDLVAQRETSAAPIINKVDSDDTTLTGTGVAGSHITVTFPGGQKAETDVTPEGTWLVEIPVDLNSGDKVVVSQKEIDKLPAQAETEVQKTQAEVIDVVTPTDKVVADNKDQLTDVEKQQVKDNVEGANSFPVNTKVDVADNGDTTITYPDGSKDTISGNDLVSQRETSATPVVNPVDSDDTTLTGTGVAGAHITVTFPGGQKAETDVTPEGTWSVDIPVDLNAGDHVSVTQKETDKLPASTEAEVQKTNAEAIDVVVPSDKVVADNKDQLTEGEKKQVKDNIEKNNSFPDTTKIDVADNGDTTITYPDGSKDTIPGDQLVSQRETSATPVVNPVDSDDTSLTGTGVAGSHITVTFPGGKTAETDVTPQGTWAVEIPVDLNAGDKVSVTQKETDKLPATAEAEVQKTNAEATDVVTPSDKVIADNKDQLTYGEKQQVKDNVEGANTFSVNTQVDVADNGDVTITYPDGSKDSIPGTDVVSQRETSAAPTINAVDSDDTTLSGTGVAGSHITVTFPGNKTAETDVTPEGTWSVDIPVDLNAGDTVTVSQKETDKLPATAEAEVQKTQAEKIDVVTPSDKVVADNKDQLTDGEKQQVKENVEGANTFPENTKVDVAGNGDTTITYPDGSKDTIPGDQLVSQRDTSATPTINPVDSDDTAISGKGVAGSHITVTFPGGQKAETDVTPEGTWSVNIPVDLNAGDTVTVSQKETDKLPATAQTEVQKTNAEAIDVVVPTEKIIADNKDQLTDGEKHQVEDAIRGTNTFPEHTNVDVADNGDTTITYPDGSKDTISGDQLVSQRDTSATPSINPVDSDDTSLTGTGVPGSHITVTFPGGQKAETDITPQGTWSVEIPVNLNAGDTVTVTQKETDKLPASTEAEVQKTNAEAIDVVVPSDKIVADNKDHLTNDEKQQVKANIEKSNSFPDTTKIDVADNGDTTITYPDGSKDTIPGDQLVSQRDTSAAPTINPVDSDDTKLSGTGVAGSHITVQFPGGKTAETDVTPEGTWSVTIPVDLNAGDKVSVTQKETDKLPASTEAEVQKTNAEAIDVVVPSDKVVADDKDQLSNDEKKQVEDAIREENPLPDNIKIDVADNGDTTITYPDGSKDTIPGDQLVSQRETSAAPTINAVDSDDTTLSGTGVAGSHITVTFLGNKSVETDVTPEGTWSVNIPVDLNAGDKVVVSQKETDKLPASSETEVQKTNAEATDVVIPSEKVVADNKGQLTEGEKKQVKDNVEGANTFPENTQVDVADNGDVTITYPDGSKDSIPGTDVVAQRETSAAPTINAVDSDDTTLSGTGVAGSHITVTFPGGQKAETDVTPKGTWSVDIPVDLNAGDKVVVSQKETDKLPAQAEAEVQKTNAEATDVNVPSDKVVADNKDHLTDDEKKQVEDAIRGENTLPENTQVDVADNGDTTITYPDGSQDTIPGDQLVSQRDTSAAPTINPVDSDDTKLSGTGVAGSHITVQFPGGKTAETDVTPEGKWSVDIPVDLNAGDTVTVSQKETDKLPATAEAEVQKTNAEATDVNVPSDKVIADNKDQLTDGEKKQVEDALKGENNFPDGTQIDIADNGDTTITYPDGSQDTISGNELVSQRDTSATPSINPVDSDDTTLTGAGVAGSHITVTFPGNKTAETDVAPEGTWSVDIPVDLNAGDTVTVSQKETDKLPATAEAEVQKTQAEATEVTTPSDKVVADNKDHLTDDEKKQVEDAIRGENTLPDNTKIDVADNGDTTITYPDGSQDTIPGDQLVSQRDTSAVPTINPVDSDDTTFKGAGVPGSHITVQFPGDKTAETDVTPEGTWSVDIPVDLNAGDTVTVIQKETNKLPATANAEVQKTNAEATDVVTPSDKVMADNKDQLTDGEKQQVKDNVEGTNSFPENTQVEVADNGDTTITYPDGSQDTIPGDQLVSQRDTSAAPTISPVDSDDTKLSGTGVAGSHITVTFPGNKSVETDVTPEGTWSVNIPVDLNAGDTITVTQKETDKLPATAQTEVQKTQAEATEVQIPSDKVAAGNKDLLTDAEKQQVKDNVEAANSFPENTKIEVADNGTTTITYPDGSQDTIPGSDLVAQKQFTLATATPHIQDKILTNATTISGKTTKGAEVTLTLPNGTQLTTQASATDGTWTVQLPQGYKLPYPGTVSVTAQAPQLDPSPAATREITQTIADQIDESALNLGEKTVVDFKNNLNQNEKKQVETSLRDNNISIADKIDSIAIASDGTGTITYTDGSHDTIAGEKLVVERTVSKNPNVNPVTSKDTQVTGTAFPGATVTVTLPDGTELTAKADSTGAWTAPLPEDTDLHENDLIKVFSQESGRTPSATIDVTVGGSMKDSVTVNTPTNRVVVEDDQALTDAEKNKVVEAIKDSNQNPALPAGTKISVAADGTTTVTFPDNSHITIPGNKLVVERTISFTPTLDPVTSVSKTITGTAHAGDTITITLPGGKELNTQASSNGTFSVAVPEGTPLTTGESIVAIATEPGKTASEPTSTTIQASEAEKATVTPPAITFVDDAAQLTDAEIQEVHDKFAAANPELTNFTVTETGAVNLTFADGSTKTVPAELTVKERHTSAAPTINHVDSDDLTISGTGTAGATIVVVLPDGTELAPIVVDKNGAWSQTLPGAQPTGSTITVTQTELNGKPTSATVVVAPTMSEATDVKTPGTKVEVVDPEHLTDDEKSQVEDAIREANPDLPEGTKITIDDHGNALITYPDGSFDEISAQDLVSVKHANVVDGVIDRVQGATEELLADTADPSLGVPVIGTGFIGGIFSLIASKLLRRDKREDDK